MAVHRPAHLTEQPLPPFPPHSPDPGHESKLFRPFSAARAESVIGEILVGKVKVKKLTVDEHVDHMQQRDEEHHARATTQPENPNIKQASTDVDRRSPSIKAREADVAIQNGFGDDKQYSWPGLGTWHSFSAQSEQRQQMTSPQNRIEKRMEAIDEAANESYGWPGLALGPRPKERIVKLMYSSLIGQRCFQLEQSVASFR